MKKKNDKTEAGPTFYRTPNGKFLPSVYASALGRYYPYGGTFDMPRQQMYMPLDHVNAEGGPIEPMKKGEIEVNAADFLTKMANSPLFASRYKAMRNREVSPEETEVFRQHMVNNINSVDYWPVGYEYTGEPWDKGNYVAYYNRIFYLPKDKYGIDIVGDSLNVDRHLPMEHAHTIFRKDASPTSTVHELSHASTIADSIPARVKIPYSTDPAKADAVTKFSRSDFNRSTEHKAYLDEVRKYLYDNKIYDPINKAFEESDYNNLIKAHDDLKAKIKQDPNNTELKYIEGAFQKTINPYDKPQTIQLFNSFVKNDVPSNNTQNIQYAAHGGYLAPILPMHFDKGTQIYRDTTALPFAKGGPLWGPYKDKKQEEAFQLFYSTLPENLRSDDSTYDIRGYWDSEGRPTEFNYNQPKESDGYYHAYSINSNTGEYLKSPAHSTFQHAVDEDRKIGWRPITNVIGRNIATENLSIADPEEQSFLRNTQGPVNLAHGGKLMDFPAPSLSEREANINYNVYASMPGRYYNNGGMIKRADGSYSQRGLWDNIRANKGSGKEPTKEMLAQERKIKSNQYGLGGHKAVFFATNVSEPGAADKDLTYPKDAYVYNNGGYVNPIKNSNLVNNFNSGGNMNFKSNAAYKAWLGYGHATGVFERTPGNQSVSIKGKSKDVKHDLGGYLMANGGGITPVGYPFNNSTFKAFGFANGGSFNNAGFQALPKEVQAKIKANAFGEGGSMDPLTEFNEGGTHEENIMGGIPQGMGANGQPNLVEQGETKLDAENYIFSDRLKVTKDVAEDFNFPKNFVGKTFADVSKLMDRPNSRREHDTIEETAKKRDLQNLMDAQESFKEREVAKKMEEINSLDPTALQGMGQPQAMGQEMAPEMQGQVPQSVAPMGMPQGMPIDASQIPPEMLAQMPEAQQGAPVMACGGHMYRCGGKMYDFGGTIGTALKDYGLGIADETMSLIGLNNVIQDSAYSDSASGKFMKGYANVVGGIGQKVLPMAANMIAPGSGAIVSGVQQAGGQFNPGAEMTPEAKADIAKNYASIIPQAGGMYTPPNYAMGGSMYPGSEMLGNMYDPGGPLTGSSDQFCYEGQCRPFKNLDEKLYLAATQILQKGTKNGNLYEDLKNWIGEEVKNSPQLKETYSQLNSKDFDKNLKEFTKAYIDFASGAKAAGQEIGYGSQNHLGYEDFQLQKQYSSDDGFGEKFSDITQTGKSKGNYDISSLPLKNQNLVTPTISNKIPNAPSNINVSREEMNEVVFPTTIPQMPNTQKVNTASVANTPNPEIVTAAQMADIYANPFNYTNVSGTNSANAYLIPNVDLKNIAQNQMNTEYSRMPEGATPISVNPTEIPANYYVQDLLPEQIRIDVPEPTRTTTQTNIEVPEEVMTMFNKSPEEIALMSNEEKTALLSQYDSALQKFNSKQDEKTVDLNVKQTPGQAAMQAAPAIYNMGIGAGLWGKPEYYKASDYTTAADIKPYEYNIDPQVKEAQKTYAQYNNYLRNMGLDAGAVATNLSAAANGRNEALGRLYTEKLNADAQNAYAAKMANKQIEQSNRAIGLNVDSMNRALKAAKLNYLQTGLGQVADIGRNNQLTDLQLKHLGVLSPDYAGEAKYTSGWQSMFDAMKNRRNNSEEKNS